MRQILLHILDAVPPALAPAVTFDGLSMAIVVKCEYSHQEAKMVVWGLSGTWIVHRYHRFIGMKYRTALPLMLLSLYSACVNNHGTTFVWMASIKGYTCENKTYNGVNAWMRAGYICGCEDVCMMPLWCKRLLWCCMLFWVQLAMKGTKISCPFIDDFQCCPSSNVAFTNRDSFNLNKTCTQSGLIMHWGIFVNMQLIHRYKRLKYEQMNHNVRVYLRC